MKRRYYVYGTVGSYIEEVRRGLFARSKKTHYVPFLFYEEGGEYYEILKGRYLGVCPVPEGVGGKNRIINVPESTFSIPLYLCGPTESPEAAELTASEFSEKVKEHLPLKPVEKEIIDNFFLKKHEEWVATTKKNETAILENETAEGWIDKFIGES